MKTRAHPGINKDRSATAAKATLAESKKSKRRLKKDLTERSGTARKEPAKPVALLLEHFPGPEMERVCLEVFYPGANGVFIAGSFNDWHPSAIPLQPQGGGRWAVDLMLKRGRYEYRFIVDGQWMDDPLSPAYVSNPFGGLNGVLAVGAPSEIPFRSR